MNRRCPCCRLPNKPHTVFFEHVGTDHIVTAVCEPCRARLSGIPRATVKAAYRRAAVRAAGDPAPYWCAVFQDRGAAQTVLGMLQHQGMTAAAARAIGWLEAEGA